MDDQLHLLTGAYALNALDDDERRRFERTLPFGDPTAEEARELAETAALLAAATTPVAPPPGLKARLMAQVAVTPQLTPHLDAGSRPDVAGSRPDVAGSRPAAPGPAPAEGDSQEVTPRGAGGAEAGVADLGERRRRAPRFPASTRWFGAAAAVLLVAAGAAGWWGLRAQQQRDDALRQLAVATTAPGAGMGRILAAPDAKVQEVPVPGGGTMLIVHSQKDSVGGVMTVGMPATPPGHVYELWLADASGAMQPAGLMPGGEGTTWNELSGGLGSSTAIGVTVEPAGGSPAPTTDPILVTQFS